jgi:DNA-binding HxlR family transcriptional regulator
MFVEDLDGGVADMAAEGLRKARTKVRANVRRAPGPCAHWDDQDADFIREVLDLVGDKWSVLIIGTLADGPTRYSDLADAIPGISQRMLTLTLKQLQRTGLVTRTAYPEVPPRVEYSLTGLGTSLLDTVLAMAAWSAEHHAEIRGHQAAFDAAASSADAS